MRVFTWIVLLSIIGASNQAGKNNNKWKKRFKVVEQKLDTIFERQEIFQDFVAKRLDELKEYVENALMNSSFAAEKHHEKSKNLGLMPADAPMVEFEDENKSKNNKTYGNDHFSPQIREDVVEILKSMEKSLEQMHKKEMRRLSRLQETLDTNLLSQATSAPIIHVEPDKKDDDTCIEIDKSIRKMSDNLERDHKDIQQGVSLLQHQMSLDMGSGLRAMQLDILQCTRSVTELHRTLIGVSKRAIGEKLDHAVQQDESSMFIFNRHPTPIGMSNDSLQEIPVANMKVVSAVLNGRPRSCAEVHHQGFQKNGIFSIWPQFNSSARLQLYAYCDMDTEGGGWTVIQRRGDFGGRHENFTRPWSDYKRGFGHVSREFWLGLDPIYALTHQEDVELRIEMETWRGEKRFANYYEFQIADESDLYRLKVGNFTGDVEDCFSSYHNGIPFSTIDSNNSGLKSRFCVHYQGEGGGWWYDNCYRVKLNSIFYPQGENDRGQGVQWRCWKGYWYSLKHVEMKVRPLCFPEKCN